ncbi:class I SAM-dependent methyltransferase [Thiocystis violascens]|uniref:Methylase involved in ubiquinone/menaquinone biosynthesis n=1 Tax=Thiocystis violascens (strain ATCC 17096 / DSM 198 / 6111) TaxID=765911 RepID=I3YH86_THIV6|nr:class I SAM-dependent methyltransferase [Thiocystis violascens]AFL76354.1 methylase involved in ubiquinone/menaquinone biosynthesis [Thiocystis violascens DSM 198]
MASISPPMQINDPAAYRRRGELEVIEDLLSVRGLKVLELGCGAAWITRELVTRFGAAQVTATEVDAIQHAKNLALAALPAVEFRAGGAESIADPDAFYDRVFMFKSLHHVPVELMDRALGEIHRVLTPGGLLYVSEPVYWGDFNEIMRLIDDEREVRAAAFAALGRAIDRRLFRLEREVFYESEGVYPDWDSFAARFIQVTHTERNLDAARLVDIRAAFERHLTPDGARFFKPHRVDLLRRI